MQITAVLSFGYPFPADAFHGEREVHRFRGLCERGAPASRQSSIQLFASARSV